MISVLDVEDWTSADPKLKAASRIIWRSAVLRDPFPLWRVATMSSYIFSFVSVSALEALLCLLQNLPPNPELQLHLDLFFSSTSHYPFPQHGLASEMSHVLIRLGSVMLQPVSA